MINQAKTIHYLLFTMTILFFVSCESAVDSDLSVDKNVVALDEELSVIRELIYEDPNQALNRADQVIEESESLNAVLQSGTAKWYKGYVYDVEQQDVAKAYFYYQESLKDLEKTDALELKTKVYINLGSLYDFYGQYESAIEIYNKAIESVDQLKEEQLTDLYFNLGRALQLQGDEDKFFEAEEAYAKSLEYAKAINDEENIVSVMNQIGMMYKAVEEHDMARISFKEIIRNYRGNEEVANYVGMAYQGIGESYLEEGKIDEAISNFEKALVFKNNSGSIFFSKFSLGSALLKAGHDDEAVRTFKEALNENHDKTNPDQVMIYSQLTDALARTGEFKEALGYSQIFNSSMQGILEQKKYEGENRVLFAEIVREYDAFNTNQSPISIWLIITLILIGGGVMIYIVNMKKGKESVSTKQLDALRSEFRQFKVD